MCNTKRKTFDRSPPVATYQMIEQRCAFLFDGRNVSNSHKRDREIVKKKIHRVVPNALCMVASRNMLEDTLGCYPITYHSTFGSDRSLRSIRRRSSNSHGDFAQHISTHLSNGTTRLPSKRR